MKQQTHTHRRVIAVLLATVALPFTPALAQETAAPTAVTPPPAVTGSPYRPLPGTTQPPVVRVTPPAPSTTAPTNPPPPSTITSTPAPEPTVEEVADPAEETPPPRAERRTTRSTAAPRRAPVREAAPEPAPAEAAPVAAAPAEIPPATDPLATDPLATTPEAIPPAEEPVAPEATTQPDPVQYWPYALGAGLILLGAIAFFVMRRRRRADEEYHYDEQTAHLYEEPVAEPVREEPVPVAAAPEPVVAEPAPIPVAPVPVQPAPRRAPVSYADAAFNGQIRTTPEPQEAAPIAAAPVADPIAEQTVEEVSVSDAETADVEAMAAASDPDAGRPWLEFMMRPIRAGTNDDDAIVEFELTVGNTGSVRADGVRISTWMFAAGSAQESEMERLLIDPPADAQVSEVTIEPGDGARVEAAIALPRSALRDTVLPVVVADARYRLPDGSEGRTSASFAVGLPSGEGLEPFAVDLPSGLQDGVEARLHGEPQRV